MSNDYADPPPPDRVASELETARKLSQGWRETVTETVLTEAERKWSTQAEAETIIDRLARELASWRILADRSRERAEAAEAELARARQTLRAIVLAEDKPITALTEDHARGCEGRTYTCNCGYDNRVAAKLDRLTSELTQWTFIASAEAAAKRDAEAKLARARELLRRYREVSNADRNAFKG